MGVFDGVAFTWKGTFVAGTVYYINDVVSYSGSTYIAVQGGTSTNPSISSMWALMSQKGDIGATGPAGPSEVSAKVFAHKQTGQGAATHSLNIGDSDTGINWVSDGTLDVYANNTAVQRITSTEITINKKLNVNTATSALVIPVGTNRYAT